MPKKSGEDGGEKNRHSAEAMSKTETSPQTL